MFQRRRVPANGENKAMGNLFNTCDEKPRPHPGCSGPGTWLALVYGGGDIMKTKTNVKAGTKAGATPTETIVFTYGTLQVRY